VCLRGHRVKDVVEVVALVGVGRDERADRHDAFTGGAGIGQRRGDELVGQSASGEFVVDLGVVEDALGIGVDVGGQPGAHTVNADLVALVLAVGGVDDGRLGHGFPYLSWRVFVKVHGPERVCALQLRWDGAVQESAGHYGGGKPSAW
jgi:hypothetical protein